MIELSDIKSGFIDAGTRLLDIKKSKRYEVSDVQWDCKNPPKYLLIDVDDGTVHGPMFWSRLVDEEWDIEYVSAYPDIKKGIEEAIEMAKETK